MLGSPSAKARYIWRRALQPNQLDAEWILLPQRLSAAYYAIRVLRIACTALGCLAHLISRIATLCSSY